MADQGQPKELLVSLADLLPLAAAQAHHLAREARRMENFSKTVTPPDSVAEVLKARCSVAETGRQAIERARALLKEAGLVG